MRPQEPGPASPAAYGPPVEPTAFGQPEGAGGGAFGLDGLPGQGVLPAGTRVSHYRIERLLAQGGMGAVYLAHQERPAREVALKIVRPGLVSTRLLRRFEIEAEALGRLQHAGIASIHEAGTFQSGQGLQPFFAMEYVVGQPLTDWVIRKRLDLRGRLALMAKVCDAVQHAHTKGVVHRDLKPGNVLVAEAGTGSSGGASPAMPDHTDALTLEASVGQPKILDFGVARLTDHDVAHATMVTDLGQLVGTLPYMSPEQVGGNPHEVDTRSDVYALGVMLYEVLTGQLPYPVAGKPLPEAARMIGEEDPDLLGAGLRGDVGTMVGKALAKQKHRRYQTAAALAADLRRYLSHQPIAARPPNALYHLQRFAQRHTALVGGAMAALVALLVALIVMTAIVVELQTRNNELMAENEQLRQVQRKVERGP